MKRQQIARQKRDEDSRCLKDRQQERQQWTCTYNSIEVNKRLQRKEQGFGFEPNHLCVCLITNLFCNRGVKFVITTSQQTCFASGLVDYALLLCSKFAAKLPHQVCHDKLISRKIELAASVYAIRKDMPCKPYFSDNHETKTGGSEISET
ncbi:hypothetical protein AVEN_186534-1 [Araneus ventricosus]|uniref:Uncharacterized protein n=1 Tax=Araneus ventricosus TaxID=182803 RepID=A0A4Y2JAJ9_ARAVE|nr:hypothetical protein AVEN_186534-1 [Araneus ventricosus]